MSRPYRRQFRRKRRRTRRSNRSHFARGLQNTPRSVYHADDVRAFPYEDYYEERERHPRHGKGAPALKKPSVATQNFIKNLPPGTQEQLGYTNSVPTDTQKAITAGEHYSNHDIIQAGKEWLQAQGVKVSGAAAGTTTYYALQQVGAGILSNNPVEFAGGVASLTAIAGTEAVPYIQRGAQTFLAARAAYNPAPAATPFDRAINAITALYTAAQTSALTSINNAPAPGTTNLERGL